MKKKKKGGGKEKALSNATGLGKAECVVFSSEKG